MPCFAERQLYVTSLREGRSRGSAAQHPTLGGLFRAGAPVARRSGRGCSPTSSSRGGGGGGVVAAEAAVRNRPAAGGRGVVAAPPTAPTAPPISAPAAAPRPPPASPPIAAPAPAPSSPPPTARWPGSYGSVQADKRQRQAQCGRDGCDRTLHDIVISFLLRLLPMTPQPVASPLATDHVAEVMSAIAHEIGSPSAYDATCSLSRGTGRSSCSR